MFIIFLFKFGEVAYFPPGIHFTGILSLTHFIVNNIPVNSMIITVCGMFFYGKWYVSVMINPSPCISRDVCA